MTVPKPAMTGYWNIAAVAEKCWVCGQPATTTIRVSGFDEPRCEDHKTKHVPACACEECDE